MAENSQKLAKDGTYRGGVRKGAGRRPGSKNKATLEQGAALSTLARTHTEDAVGVLFEIMKDKKAPETARIAAASIILDRGYGKVAQQIVPPTGDGYELEAETQAVRSSKLLASLLSQIDGAVSQDHYRALAAPNGGDGGEVVEADFSEVKQAEIVDKDGESIKQSGDGDGAESEMAENSQIEIDPLTGEPAF